MTVIYASTPVETMRREFMEHYCQRTAGFNVVDIGPEGTKVSARAGIELRGAALQATMVEMLENPTLSPFDAFSRASDKVPPEIVNIAAFNLEAKVFAETLMDKGIEVEGKFRGGETVLAINADDMTGDTSAPRLASMISKDMIVAEVPSPAANPARTLG